jgi:hypothetical protein
MHNTTILLNCIALANLRQPLLRMLQVLSTANNKLMTKISTIFLILAFDVATIQKLSEVRSKRIVGQDFATNFEVNWSF